MLDFEVDFLLEILDFVCSGTGDLPWLQQEGKQLSEWTASEVIAEQIDEAFHFPFLCDVYPIDSPSCAHAATNLRATRNEVQGCFQDDLHSVSIFYPTI